MQQYTKESLREWVNSAVYDELHEEGEPIFVLTGSILLYPQYNPRAMFNEWMATPELRTWLGTRAFEELKGDRGASEVRSHWKSLVQTVVDNGRI